MTWERIAIVALAGLLAGLLFYFTRDKVGKWAPGLAAVLGAAWGLLATILLRRPPGRTGPGDTLELDRPTDTEIEDVHQDVEDAEHATIHLDPDDHPDDRPDTVAELESWANDLELPDD